MDLSFVFWFLMLMALIFQVGGYWGPYANNPGFVRFNGVWLWVLLAILGFAVFGFAIHR